MDKTYLSNLISGLKQELLRFGYTKGSMIFYRRRWNQLMAYAEDRDECFYTEQLGMNFLKECFESFNWMEKKLCLTQSKTRQPIELPLVPDLGWAVIDYQNIREAEG